MSKLLKYLKIFKMIIAIDGSRAFLEKRTGTENYSYQIIKHLSKIDTENDYLIYTKADSKIEDKWPHNFKFQSSNFKYLWTQVGLAKQTFKDKVDVLFVPAHTLPIIRKPGLRTVVTVHDLGSEFLPKTHQLKQRLYLSFMQKVQLRGATHLIAVSEATKKDLVKKIGINPKKITVVYEGYDREKFKVDVLVNSLRYYELEPGKYFLFVGTVQPRKNLERLIKVFALLHLEGAKAHLRGVKLVIAGSKGWLSDEIYKLPKKLGIEDKVKFLGYVSEKDLPALYSGAIALTFPSFFEGFGLPIIEAQACGCPVLTSNISSMIEVAGKGAILVDPYKEQEIENAMIKMMDEKIRQKLMKSGLKNIKRFSWEKAARQTLDILQKTGTEQLNKH